MRARWALDDSARNLAAARIIVFVSALIGLWQVVHTVHVIPELPPELLWPAGPWMARLMRLIPPSPAVVEFGTWLFVVLCVMGIAGIAARWCALAASLVSIYLFGLAWCLGKTGHEVHHVPQLLAILAASPCTDVWSLVRSRRAPDRPGRGLQYGVPLRVMWVLVGLAYLFPGYWKFQAAGLGWITGDQMRWALWDRWSWWEPIVRIDRWPLALPLAGLGACVYEIVFIPLALWRPTRAWVALFGLLFHTGIWVTMGINFAALSLVLLTMLDWDRLAGGLRADPGRDRPVPLGAARAGLLACGTALGAAIAGGMIYYGVAHDTRAWPVGCYPTFAWVTEPLRRTSHVYAVDAAGDEAPLPDQALEEYFGHRWDAFHGTMTYIRHEVPREQQRREAFIRLWARHAGVPPGTVTLRLWEVQCGTDPDAPVRSRKKTRVLAELAMPPAATAPE